MLLLGIVALAVTAAAENGLHVGGVTAAPGERGVSVPIAATTTDPLSVLAVDITFDPALCRRIEGQSVHRAGRTLAGPEEGAEGCPGDGRVRLVIADILGETVVPPGDGLIAEWAFDVRADAPEGVFQLTVSVAQFRNGPLSVPVSASGGEVIVAGSAAITPSPTGPPVTTGTTPTETPPAAGETHTPTPERTETGTPGGTGSPTLTPGGGGLPGDANCDDRVSAADVTELQLVLGSARADRCGRSDVNGDKSIDGADVPAILRALFE